jgi:hypothetical protein
MIVLDENVVDSQCVALCARRVRFRQIARELAVRGIDDSDIIPLLHRLRRPTFFTRDLDFDRPELCHGNYCLVVLAVRKDQVAEYVVRVLRHPQLDTHARRMGKVIRAGHSGLVCWSVNAKRPVQLGWP